ncbi:MAG: peptidoglycan-binding protein [Candidatus Omnitrophica bacterium]|nr:peptidoglycan-binding protein [Candidatus Omnitrophota bacterium]MBU4477790.1 peptidoglycan-binding protein [Candidatus Omnitrophota bacterium]
MGKNDNLQVQELQRRIEYLEQEVQKKDQEINNLEDGARTARTQNFSYGEPSAASNKRVKRSGVSVKLSAKQIQTALKKAGFYNGALDGKVGPNTKKAIKAFQKAHGLKADGVAGQNTCVKLKQYLR